MNNSDILYTSGDKESGAVFEHILSLYLSSKNIVMPALDDLLGRDANGTFDAELFTQAIE